MISPVFPSCIRFMTWFLRSWWSLTPSHIMSYSEVHRKTWLYLWAGFQWRRLLDYFWCLLQRIIRSCIVRCYQCQTWVWGTAAEQAQHPAEQHSPRHWGLWVSYGSPLLFVIFLLEDYRSSVLIYHLFPLCAVCVPWLCGHVVKGRRELCVNSVSFFFFLNGFLDLTFEQLWKAGSSGYTFVPPRAVEVSWFFIRFQKPVRRNVSDAGAQV